MAFDLPTLAELAAETPTELRVAVGLAGGLVLFWGARLYKPGLLASAFAAGALAAVGGLDVLAEWIPGAHDPVLVSVGAGSAGVVAAVVAHLAHQAALVVVGAMVGLLTAAALVGGLALPWWLVPIGAFVGAVGMPRVYRHLLKVVTPAVGAVVVAWAVGMPDAAWLMGALWLVGAAWQIRGPQAADEPEPE